MEKCFSCGKGLLEEYYTDIYGTPSCKCHIDSDKSVSVCSECLQFVRTEGNTISDGRVICPECMKIAVSPKRPYDWILNQVLERLHQFGFDNIMASDVKIWTATSKEMAAYRKSDVNVFNEGFCSLTPNGKIKIYVQSHHTKIHFAGVLAHELLHAWCFRYGLYNIPPEIAEGVCNLGSFAIYSTIDYPLSKIYIKQLFDDKDPIYGDGFRAVYEFYKEHGWDGVRALLVHSNNQQ